MHACVRCVAWRGKADRVSCTTVLHICMHVCMSVLMLVCVYRHTYIHADVKNCSAGYSVRMRTSMRLIGGTRTHTQTIQQHPYIYIHIHTYLQTYIHTHTQICVSTYIHSYMQMYRIVMCGLVADRTCVILCILFFGLWPRVVCNMQHTMRHNLYPLFWFVAPSGSQHTMRHNLYPHFWFVAPSR